MVWQNDCYMIRASRLLSGLALSALCLSPAIAHDSGQKAPSGSQAVSESPATAEIRSQRDQLVIENQIRDETLRRETASQAEELERIKLETQLTRARADRELAQKRLEIEKAKLEMEEISTAVALESARMQSQTEKELASLRAAKERAEMEAQLAVARFTQKNNEYKTQEVAWTARLNELGAKLAEREKELEADSYVDQRPVYLKDPLQANGDLIISDRRIPLNGPITAETADFICERIDFYNNKNKEFPIFLVIDQSPGGSVMSGYKILKSMQSSSAPVYVVVKSYAASMAAAICALAQRSFAYPNAIILHHQISNGMRGNLAAQREGVKMLEEWWQRLAAPIAAKMGISTEEFSKLMYEHSSTGDWQEFADNAVKLKWVDTVVTRCEETALIKHPDIEQTTEEKVATSGKASAKADASSPGRGPVASLPRLSPLDCYYLYNPDGYYRVE